MRARSSNWIEQGTPKPKVASSILAGRERLLALPGLAVTLQGGELVCYIECSERTGGPFIHVVVDY